jgi:hypothetical protein
MAGDGVESPVARCLPAGGGVFEGGGRFLEIPDLFMALGEREKKRMCVIL